MEKPITIKDIAKKLGLSTSTVSRALSDSWEIKKETKELVIKTAAELNYHPNTQAKGLVTKKSYTIGIVVPELVTSFFPMIISGIQKILMHEGYQILITQSNESAETERTNLSLLEQHMVDGIIISTTSDSFVKAYRIMGFHLCFSTGCLPTLILQKLLLTIRKWPIRQWLIL